MNSHSRIFVAGHTGLIGSALTRKLESKGCTQVITIAHSEMDLTDGPRVSDFFQEERPEYVFLAAGKVGGIHSNMTRPAEYIHANLSLQTSVIHAAYAAGVKRLVFFGSTCAYPEQAQQPMAEEQLLNGPMEPASEAYAIAKVAGMKMCEAYNRQYGTCFISIIPPTVYGPYDNFHSEDSHVLSALIAKYHRALQAGEEKVVIWGSGKPRREFLYADDLADACIFLASLPGVDLDRVAIGPSLLVNVGSGEDITVMELAKTIQETVGFNGKTAVDTTRPDGAAQKLLDSARMTSLGWQPKTPLVDGIEKTYSWYLDNEATAA